MAVGLSASEANTFLDGFDGMFIQRHVGDPGAAGTANLAAGPDRQAVSLAASAGGVAASDADLVWESVAADEDATHWSGHTLVSGGVFRCSGVITADAYLAGNTFTIPAGSFVLTAPNVAA